MKYALVFIGLAATCAFPQESQWKPDTVVVTMNGRKLTAAEVESLVKGMPSNIQEVYRRDPRKFLEDTAWLDVLRKQAEEAKLDQQSPLKEFLENQRLITLARAQLDEGYKQVMVMPDEQKKHYESHREQYREVKARLIYVPFSAAATTPGAEGQKKVLSEPEAKERSEKIVAQARAGVDFVKLVKEFSEDPGSVAQEGNMGFGVRSTTPPSQLPEPLKKAILALKPGEISNPLRHDNGFFVFRVESAEVLPYEQVKDDIYRELKDIGFNQWKATTQKQATVSVENEEFFKPRPAAAQP